MKPADQISTAEAARELGVHQKRINALIAACRLPATKIAGRWIIKRADLDKVRVRKIGRPKKPE